MKGEILPQTSTGAQFNIIKHRDFYTVQRVLLPKGAIGDVQVTSNLLNDGHPGTQSELAKTGWLGSAPLITALYTTLYYKQGHEGVEELRKLFADDYRRHMMMTATGITYRAEPPDLVTHNFGTPAAHTLEARLVWPNGYVDARMGDVTQALLGNTAAGRVMEVYEWVTGKKPSLLRVNYRPNQDVERALVIGCNLGGFLILASDDINLGRHARGVRVAPPSSTGSKG